MRAQTIVQDFYANLAKGDRSAAYRLLAEDFVLKQADSLPYGGEYRGAAALDDFFRRFNGYWKEFHTLETAFYEVGDRVFAQSQIRGRNDRNRLIETEMIQVYKVEEQRIVSAQPFYFDTALLLDDDK